VTEKKRGAKKKKIKVKARSKFVLQSDRQEKKGLKKKIKGEENQARKKECFLSFCCSPLLDSLHVLFNPSLSDDLSS
jgi:hypothetical protein